LTVAVDSTAAAESMTLALPGHDRPFTLEAGTPGKDLPA
jgi:hypothetical protein